ncbi:cytochrome c-type biogenesis protein [Candidatus Sororendozoicomonas aggregata]|uniref:cytochrome c-type biogenesis protein n=1 Tax=Candidatus Sororendozoicomonas aggregata TaxID=3073239 RepID=UPI002ED27C25
MKYFYRSLVAVLFALLSTSAFAVIGSYTFDTPEQEARFFKLITELRCPKCQNQSIADSNAPIAQDLRQTVHRMVLAGDDDQQVIDFMLARYGDFILYKPRLDKKTVILWFGPVVLLLLGLLVLIMIIKHHRRMTREHVSTVPLTSQEQETLDSLLDKNKGRQQP